MRVGLTSVYSTVRVESGGGEPRPCRAVSIHMTCLTRAPVGGDAMQYAVFLAVSYSLWFFEAYPHSELLYRPPLSYMLSKPPAITRSRILFPTEWTFQTNQDAYSAALYLAFTLYYTHNNACLRNI